MPIEPPEDPLEDSPDSTEKKWRYRKPSETPPEPLDELVKEPANDSGEESVETPSEDSRLNLNDDLPVIAPGGEEVRETVGDQYEEPSNDIEREIEDAQLPTESASSNLEIERAKPKNQDVSKQVEDLLSQIEEVKSKKNVLTEELATVTEELAQANTNNAEHQEKITELEAKLHQITESEKEKTKKLKKTEEKLSKAEEKTAKLEKDRELLEKTKKEREEHLLTQLEAMAEQIGKLREVIRKRDDELVALQKEILVKKDLAQDAQEEASQLRTVGIVQREAVQDTTVLRRRATDLEIELEHLKKALEKDPKYRIYLLVRETGQRTLEELSKILGVGVFEARRRVQELVRAGLLELKGEAVKLARRIK
jgi:chromosome segregation ATPase